MAVVDVKFDGNIEDLQDQLEDSDLQAEVDVEGQGQVGGAAQSEDQGLIGTATRGAIVGAILAVVGLLGPIKGILEGIRNFFLLNLAPVFTAFRPLISSIQDILINIGRFLSGDLKISDLIDAAANALKKIANEIITSLNQVPGLDFQPPFPETGGGGNGRKEGRRAGFQPAETSGRTLANDAAFTGGPFAAIATGGGLILNEFLSDRTDEAKKDALKNQQSNQNQDVFGGDAGSRGGPFS